MLRRYRYGTAGTCGASFVARQLSGFQTLSDFQNCPIQILPVSKILSVFKIRIVMTLPAR
jgi:hypothetical protein